VLAHAPSIDFEENMSFAHWLTVAAMAALPFAVGARQKQPQADPTDATAPVSVSAYESAFKNYRSASDEQQSPDKTWRAANDEAGKLGGHAGQMKDDSNTPADSAPAHAMPADHSKHH
jgi:hypothetical protein